MYLVVVNGVFELFDVFEDLVLLFMCFEVDVFWCLDGECIEV